jgi:hypothetical protein
VHGTDHVIKLAGQGAPDKGKDDCAQNRADETLNRLLWRELDERCTSHGDPTDIREDVVADDQARGDPEPDDTFEDVVHDEVAGNPP